MYEVVRGSGTLLYGPVKRQDDRWAVPGNDWRSVAVREGDAFTIPEGCAHQLRNASPADGDLVILVECPEAHLTTDRTLLADAPAR